MPKAFYILSNGELKRKQNTILFENETGDKKFIPVENINELMIYGELKLNKRTLEFLSQNKIPLHFFNYYGFYIGSFYPRQIYNSGFILIKQTESYLNYQKRLYIAKEIISATIHNLKYNLKHYQKQEIPLSETLETIEKEENKIQQANSIPELMAIEGHTKHLYYQTFNKILKLKEEFTKRTKRPPTNPINALISFGNSLLYATILSEIYHTHLNPTISYLHEPSERRFSLALDLAEIFKPIIPDRTTFKLINNQMLKPQHFEEKLNYCYLKEQGRKIYLQEFNNHLLSTFHYRPLNRHISYKKLIRLECYKLEKYLIGEQDYKAFRTYW